MAGPPIKLKDNAIGHSKIVIPMYNEIVNEIKSYDQFGETITHLQCNEYKKSFVLLNQIENAQNNYNQYVSSLFSEYETKIIDLVENSAKFQNCQ